MSLSSLLESGKTTHTVDNSRKSMKTIIAGSRDITNPWALDAAVKACPWTITHVVSGNARGVDKLGEIWARFHKLPLTLYPVTKQDWQIFGKRAGIYRNIEMARNAEALLAVWDNISHGTYHMIQEATEIGLRVYVHYV